MEFTPEQLADILKTDSESLASVIIANRVLGCYKEATKQCMIELMKRKLGGDEFDYEGFINNKVKELNFTVNLNGISKMKNKLSQEISLALVGGITSVKNVFDEED